MNRSIAIALSIFASTAALAEHSIEENGPDYQFLEISAGRQHFNGAEDHFDVLKFSGEFGLTANAFLFGSYAGFSDAKNDETHFLIDQYELGVGMHWPLSSLVDAVIGGAYQKQSVDLPGMTNVNRDGTYAMIGLRGTERESEYGMYYKRGKLDDKTVSLLGIDVAYYLDASIAITGTIEHDFDNVNATSLGLRVGF